MLNVLCFKTRCFCIFGHSWTHLCPNCANSLNRPGVSMDTILYPIATQILFTNISQKVPGLSLQINDLHFQKRLKSCVFVCPSKTCFFNAYSYFNYLNQILTAKICVQRLCPKSLSKLKSYLTKGSVFFDVLS